MSFKSVAQCGAGGITFSSQADIDNFTTNYPGCTQILGNLNITGNDITNLNGLSVITSVGGSLNVVNNPKLTSIVGLSNLTSVGTYVGIQSNDVLTNLMGLSKLETVGSYMGITYNPALSDVSGLSSLKSVGGSLSISVNPSLVNLTGLSNLVVTGGLTINANSSLERVTGLDNLTSFSGASQLTISGNPLLTSIIGLSKLTSTGSTVNVSINPMLTSLDGFVGLKTLGGPLVIVNNASLANLNELSNLTSMYGLRIVDNPNLTNLNGLSHLSTVGGFPLTIDNNSALTTLTGLNNINPLTISNLTIKNSSVLSLCELPNICSYLSNPSNTGIVTISGNAPNCISRAAIQAACIANMTTTISGKIYREDNAAIQNANLKLVGGGNTYTATSDINGDYTFSNIPIGGTYILTMTKTNDSPANGISIADMFKITQHNLGILPLNSPYKMIAADVNNDGSIDASDILALLNFILVVTPNLPAGGWLFIPSDYVFTNPNDPFSNTYPQSKTINLISALSNVNFIGLKRGDVNNSAVTKP